MYKRMPHLFRSTLRCLKCGYWTSAVLALVATLPMASGVTLAWDPSPDTGVTGYAIRHGTASSNYTFRVDAGNVTSATISNLIEGVTYYFVAVAYTADGLESLPSNEVSYTVPLSQTNTAPVVDAGADQAITLPASAILTASVADDGLPTDPGVLAVTWSKMAGPGVVSFQNAASLTTTATFTLGGTYVLRATVNDGALTAFDELTVTVLAAPLPATPSALSATPYSNTEIVLSWTDNSTNETGFQIERSLDAASWSFLGTVSANTTTYKDSDLISGTVYYYRVLAWDNWGVSAPTMTAAAAPFIYSLATSDSLVTATLVGNYAGTFQDDAVYEQLTERLSGGKPNTRYSTLEHKWIFQVTPGKSMVLFLQAHHTASSDGDDFVLAYSTDDLTYTDMMVVEATADAGEYQSFILPSTLSGTIYVRVRDTDHTVGNVALDTLLVDHLLIRTDVSPVTSPPPAPILQQAIVGNQTVALTWTPSEGATSHSIWRRTGTNDFAEIIAGITCSTFTDTNVSNGTTYEYAVTALNANGESAASNFLTATPQSPTITDPPTALTATAGKRKITLNWTQSPTPGVTQNRIYRSPSGNSGTYSLQATVATTTTYSDSVPTGTTYYYIVTAVSTCGESVASNAAGATAK